MSIATLEELREFATPKDQNDKPYEIEALKAAFELVKPAKGWKYPIDATFAGNTDDIYQVKTAIEFYVGGPTRIFVESHAKNLKGETIFTVRFENAGYYNNMVHEVDQMKLEEMSFAELERLESEVHAELNSRMIEYNSMDDLEVCSANPLYYGRWS